MSSHLLQCRTVRFAGRSPRCYRGGWFEQNAEPYSNLHGEVWVSFEEGTVEQRLTVEMKCDAEVMTKFTMQRFKQLRYSTNLQQLQLLNLMKLWHCHKEGHVKAYQGQLAYVPKPGLSIGIPDHAHRMIVNVILTANIQANVACGFREHFCRVRSWKCLVYEQFFSCLGRDQREEHASVGAKVACRVDSLAFLLTRLSQTGKRGYS